MKINLELEKPTTFEHVRRWVNIAKEAGAIDSDPVEAGYMTLTVIIAEEEPA